jgi:hypothetical protein
MFKNKTGKREIAVILTGVLCWAIFGGDVAMVEAIVYPILAYVAAASGLHIYQQRRENVRIVQESEG